MLAPIVSWGEVLWDRFPSGALLGGAPANVAWHLAMLGSRVMLITRVGDDEDGRLAARTLQARGVDTSLFQIDRERATGEVEVKMEHGEPRYRLVPDRAWERIEATADARAAIADAPAFVFGTFAMRTAEGLASWREAVAAAKGLRVCDPNLRPNAIERDAIAAALDVADVVKVGERECAMIEKVLGRRDLVEWLLGTRKPGAKLVAITRGAAGSTMHTPTERIEVPAQPAERGGDNVGCGDAYVAVITHGLVHGWPIGDIAAIASRWAACVASSRGACPDLDEVAIATMLADRVGAGAA